MSAYKTLRLTTKGLVNLVVSLGLAAPVQSWARDLADTSTSLSAGAATEGVPVIYHEFDTPQGRAFTLIAAVPEELERETILRLAGNDPKNLNLAVSGPTDPGLRAALDSGNLAWINTYRIGALEQSSMVRDETDAKLKSTVVTKAKTMWGNVKSARYGVMMAFGYAGVISTGAVYMQTSSVTAAIGTFVPVGLFAAFTASQSQSWLKGLNKSGDGATALVGKVAGAFGGKLDDKAKVAWKKAAMFGTTLAVSGLQGAFVTGMAGEHLEFSHLMMLAFATNYSVWDLTVDRLVHQHKIDHKWEPRYFAFQLLAGTLAELSVYAHVPNVEAALGVVVASGLSYLIAGERIENVFGKARATVRYQVDTAKGRVVAATTKVTQAIDASVSGCKGLLSTIGRYTQVVKK